MNDQSIAILQPVFALGFLTISITVLMYFSRLSAMKKHKVHPQKAQNTRDLIALLPQSVNRISNNYNHLFEQPTLFYAICISLAVLEHVNQFFIISAWAFVSLRLLHSIIQITVDNVMCRFFVFVCSWLVLASMIIYESILLFNV